MDPCVDASGVAFYGARRLLLVLHAAGSIVLIGAATHHALQMRHYLRGAFNRAALERTYAKVVSVAYVVTFALGAALYPTYRVHVRAAYLDRFSPTYAGLFDVKEVYAALTLALAIALGLIARSARLEEERWLVPVYAGMSFVVCGVVWFNVIVGLLVVSVRGVG